MVLIGVFITALYSFRMYFLVFHGKPRMDEHTRHHLHETPAVVWVPLVLLAVGAASYRLRPAGRRLAAAFDASEGNPVGGLVR